MQSTRVPARADILKVSEADRSSQIIGLLDAGNHLTTYPGGKNGFGVYHQIINRIPKHAIRGELFAGSAAISRRLLPAPILIINDKDAAVLVAWHGKPGVIVRNEDTLDLLTEFREHGDRTFLYLDPPYPFSVRRTKRPIYKFEWGELEHQIFLSRVLHLKCRVMISSYRNNIYDEALKGWHVYEYLSGTRGGARMEALYMNYDPSKCILHDYRYYGRNWKHREHLRLKVKRFTKKLDEMPPDERATVLSGILLAHSEIIKKILLV